MGVLVAVSIGRLNMEKNFPSDFSSYRGLMGFVVYGLCIVVADADKPVDPNGTTDWIGAVLGVSALILFNFCWK